MLSIITDILLMNDLDEGLAEPYYQDFDIVQLLRLLIDEHIQHAEIKNIKMNFSSNLIDTYIYSDFIKTKLIFENLISNAIKYTKLDSQVNIDVIYGTDKSSDKYDFRIVVEDYGPGISEFEINHIFDKFCKISNKPTGKEPSTGLGLAITKALCELLNYGIQVETNEKIGTKFIVLLKYNKTTTTINV
jgi:signal transduction histidine kinase